MLFFRQTSIFIPSSSLSRPEDKETAMSKNCYSDIITLIQPVFTGIIHVLHFYLLFEAKPTQI